MTAVMPRSETDPAYVAGGATDVELAAGLATKQDASTAATDAELATAKTTVESNTQTDSYTLVLADAGKIVEMNAATAKVITVPPNSTAAFPVGTVIEVSRYGAGAVTLAAGGGVTIRSSGSLLGIGGQYSSVVLRKRASDEWVLNGNLA